MLLNYLRRFKSIPTEVVGKIFVDGEDSSGGLAILDGDGSLIVGHLNPPLPYRFIRFRGAEVTGQDDEGWKQVSEELVAGGMHLLLLLDPRTYLIASEILEDVQVVSQEDSKVTLVVSYDMQKMLSVLGVPQEEAAWIADIVGIKYKTALMIDYYRVAISIQDPLPNAGSVTVHYELADLSWPVFSHEVRTRNA